MWLLGMKLRTSGRAISDPDHGSISLTHYFRISYMHPVCFAEIHLLIPPSQLLSESSYYVTFQFSCICFINSLSPIRAFSKDRVVAMHCSTNDLPEPIYQKKTDSPPSSQQLFSCGDSFTVLLTGILTSSFCAGLMHAVFLLSVRVFTCS